jgi:hypothetical protein
MSRKNIFRYNPKTGVLTPGHEFRVMTPSHLNALTAHGHLSAFTPGHLVMTPGHRAIIEAAGPTRLHVERDEDDNLIITMED